MKNKNASLPFAIFILLGIPFVALKLLGVIAWSWIWVTAPLWAPVALVVGLLIGIAVLVLICASVTTVLAMDDLNSDIDDLVL